jgi:signal transduction histidine kinase
MNDNKILIVEDELIAAESLSMDLKKLGYQVVAIVTSGEKAIKKVFETEPDLILMDIMLRGEMDGITTAENIRKSLNIPIIYLTAYADFKTIERAKSTQAYGYLVKPYKLADIRTTIAVAMAKYQEDAKVKENLAQQKKLNNLKTQALATTSHDLRNPLTNILGYTELLRDYGEQIPAPKRKRYFDFIKGAVGEMNDSLEDLLLISKAEEGKLDLCLEEFDLVSFVNYLVEQYCNLTEKHNIKYISNQEKYYVSLDRKIFRHIFTNLLSNAIKYSPKGGDIKVELICENKRILLTVEDRGIGIPNDYKDKLFQLFERGSNVGSIKGNGLGLSIVKKAVELQGGQIYVESQEGKGSKFTVIVPLLGKNQK